MEERLLIKALVLAAQRHAGQKDKAGEPYIEHPLRVMLALRRAGRDEISQATAVLHDVLEDTDCDPSEIEALDPEVARLVQVLTRRAEEQDPGDGVIAEKETYNDYIRRVVQDKVARVIKRVDILDNLNRLHLLDPGMRRSLGERYAKALNILNFEGPA